MGFANGTPYTVPESGVEIQMQYDTRHSELIIIATVPDKTWFAWGWGPTMTETAMVSWIANGEDSIGATDLYSKQHGHPATQPTNCYTSSFTVKGEFVVFTTKRPLECPGGDGYAVQLDTDSSWCAAWSPGTEIHYHNNNRTMLSCEISSAYAIGLSCDGVTDTFYAYHGIVMWSCWTVVGLLQIYTNRYLKHFWKWRHTLHYVAGTISVLLISASALFALSKNDWTIQKAPHSIAGVITFALSVLLGLAGIFSAIVLKYSTSDWDAMKFIKSKVAHKIFGLGLTIGSQVTQGYGVKSFFTFDRQPEKGNILLWLNVVFFFTMLLIGEVIYQLQKKKHASLDIHET